MSEDPGRYRVTMICRCQADYVEGYGPTPEEAQRAAERWWRKYHRGETPLEVVLEQTVEHSSGGSHYEEVPA